MPNHFFLLGSMIILCLEKTWQEHHTAEEEDVNLYNLRINPSDLGGELLILRSWTNRRAYTTSVISGITCSLYMLVYDNML